ncbi:TOBE domain-containing protein [Bradyrhizobium algeriense]|uniref:TOBE domain-containing protein n=1 Tax=Bradyrhizobium algeriense TaxID=634784 RepID=UPI001FCE74BA|nr:TOBE domain-containing protein [Bradyrhizobium algeriense]
MRRRQHSDRAVRLIEHTGSDLCVHLDLAGLDHPLIARLAAERAPQIALGQTLHLAVNPDRILVFGRDGKRRRPTGSAELAGIDLLTGKVHALVKDRHRSREFIELLRLIDAAYPPNTAIKLILDNHSAHISRETWVLHS